MATVLAGVGPGEKTGIFYITICNLPFGTSWQSLKDWTRGVCEVDHVEVFPMSTSGWVRVKGKENFEKAWKLLNGGSFNGRSIIASDKNRHEPIKIKELVDASPSRHVDQCCSSPCVQAIQDRQKSGYPLQAVHDANGSRSCGQPNFEQYPHSGALAINYSPDLLVLNTESQQLTGDTLGHYQNISPCYRGSYMDGYYPAMPDGKSGYGHYENMPHSEARLCHAEQAGYVPTEQRKVVLTHIERKSRCEEVIRWIRKRVGPIEAEIVDIDLPRAEGNGQLRGHCYIIFSSARAARDAVRALHEKKFQKRHVTARLAVEGIPVSQTSPKKSSHKNRDTRAAAGSGSGSTGGGGGCGGGPIIANGSSRTAPSDKRKK